MAHETDALVTRSAVQPPADVQLARLAPGRRTIAVAVALSLPHQNRLFAALVDDMGAGAARNLASAYSPR